MRYIYIVLVCLFVQTMAHSQNALDVLPLNGRNELFHSYLMEEGGQLWDERRAAVALSLESVEALMARRASLKADFLTLLGDLPVKTDLDAEVVGTFQGEGYTIEKLHFQSRPEHRVTANFYIPEGEGPFPAVLVMCGHYPSAKFTSIHQKLGALFATNGIAALTVDPFSQGERYQLQNPTSGALSFVGQSGTSAHSRLDVGAVLSGTSVVAHALWDNHRGIDYLYSRTDVVDTTRVGATGSSGGGAQATNLIAFDDRIKVGAVNSFLMNEETLYATIGPQTASQNLSFEGAHLIDHPDYITMFAPKPFMILATTEDFFDIGATRETYAEAQEVYNVLDATDALGYFEGNGQHGYQKPRREAAVRWFRTWFYGDTTAINEPFTLPVNAIADLQVTPTGQVVNDFENEKTITDLNVEMAAAYAGARADFWSQNSTDSCLQKVRELIRLSPYDSIQVEETETITRTGYTITKLKINSGNQVPVTGLLMVPDNLQDSAPAVVYVDGRGKLIDATEGGVLETNFVDSGKVVLTIDVRGFGETRDNPAKNESKHGNIEHRNAVISAYIGKTLIGQRVEDIMKALDLLTGLDVVDTDDITLVGIDRAGSAVIHAAALDSRVNHTVIRQSFESWVPMVGNPTELNNMTHVVPFALKYYDLTDLVNSLPTDAVVYYDDLYTIVSSTKRLFNPNSRLGQNYPNPSTAETTIPYELEKSGQVSLKIYDQNGRLALQFDQGVQAVGNYQLLIDTSSLPQGQYFYQLWLNAMPTSAKQLIRMD